MLYMRYNTITEIRGDRMIQRKDYLNQLISWKDEKVIKLAEMVEIMSDKYNLTEEEQNIQKNKG